MNPQLWWYVARAAGITAWLMLTASVLWGVVLSSDAFRGRRRPAWLLDIHRWLGALTVSFVAIHIGALVADSYTHFAIADLTIPFASQWRTGAVALGVVAMWLLATVHVTSLAVRRLPRRVWRGIHLTSYAAFWLTSLHAAYAGTDRANRLYQVTAVASVGAVAWAAIYRLAHRHPAQPPARARPPRRTLTSPSP